jgi:hypothetical protein
MALAAPRRSLVIIALNDWGYQSTEEPISRPVWENLGNSVGEIYTLVSATASFKLILHLNGHCFPQPLREQAYTFLEEALGVNGGCA